MILHPGITILGFPVLTYSRCFTLDPWWYDYRRGSKTPSSSTCFCSKTNSTKYQREIFSLHQSNHSHVFATVASLYDVILGDVLLWRHSMTSAALMTSGQVMGNPRLMLSIAYSRPGLTKYSSMTGVLRALTRRPQTWTWENSSDPSQISWKWKNWMSSESHNFCRNRAEHVIFERWYFIHDSSTLLAIPSTQRLQSSAATLRKLPSDAIWGSRLRIWKSRL